MNLLQDIIPTLWDRNFQPLSGGSVEVYTDPNMPVFAKLYSSPGNRDAELPNPLPLNSAGRFSSGSGADTPVYFDDKGVHVVFKDRNGVKAKEFLYPDFSFNGAVTTEAATIDEMKEIEGEEGLYVLVRSPAPFRWYEWADGNGTNDGVLNIPAKEGRGYWRLILQGNWAYSAWWEAGDLKALLDFFAANQPDLDLCVNSSLTGAGGVFDFLGKLKLVEGAKIEPGGKTLVYCHGGFETTKNAFANGKTVFHVYGGAYSTDHLPNIALSGFVNNLHLNSDWSIPLDTHLEVFTLSGRAGCKLTAWGALYLTETTDTRTQFEIKIGSQGSVLLNGPHIAANAFKSMADWRGIKRNRATSGGLFFHDEDEYDWSHAPEETLRSLGGCMKFSSNAFPRFANAQREAKITNNGEAYYPIPKGIRLENLSGKFDPTGGWFANETIDFELCPNMEKCAFINCAFRNEFAISRGNDCAFINCFFFGNIQLTQATYEGLVIADCIFRDGAKIEQEHTGQMTRCKITGNTGVAANYWAPDAGDIYDNSTTNTVKFKIHTNAFRLPVHYALVVNVEYTASGSGGVSTTYRKTINGTAQYVVAEKQESGAYALLFEWDVPQGGTLDWATATYIPNGTFGDLA
jgi:hypothetical protein